jgi:hypothetical protein
VYKPASWKAPAEHARYQLLDDQSFETNRTASTKVMAV